MSQQKADYADDTEIDETLDETADDATVEETVANLEERGFDVIVVDDTDEALDAVQSQIPAGASVMNGHSTTLEEIGFDNLLGEGDHEWESLPDQIWSIDDDAERQTARRESQTADYYSRRYQRDRADGRTRRRRPLRQPDRGVPVRRR